MATKKKTKLPTYYVYYDTDSSVVTGVTSDPEPGALYLEIPADVAFKFIDGTDNYSNYVVGLIKKSGRQVKGLVERQVLTYTPRAGMFERITDGADKQDLIIEWNLPNKEWIITLNTADIGGVDNQFLFFVSKEKDFNQVVTTLVVDVLELKEKSVQIPFSTDEELDINSLEVLSKLVLNSYGLKITHE